MIFRTIAITFVATLLSGCTHDLYSDSLFVMGGQTATRLQLLNGQNYYDIVFAPEISPALDAGKEDQIRRECGASKQPPQRAFIPLTFLVEPAIDFVLDRIDKALESELEQYLAVYSATQNEKFYSSTLIDGPVAGWSCFRFSRAIGPEDNEKSVFDLLGKIALSEEKDAVYIRPLRLYFGQSKAKGKEIGVTVSLKAQSVWRQHNSGQSQQIFDHQFLSEKIEQFEAHPVVKYYVDDSTTPVRLPIIPWSTNINRKSQNGDVAFTITVTEVGAPPKLLEHAIKLFTKNKGNIAEMMKNAAKKLLPQNQ